MRPVPAQHGSAALESPQMRVARRVISSPSVLDAIDDDELAVKSRERVTELVEQFSKEATTELHGLVAVLALALTNADSELPSRLRDVCSALDVTGGLWLHSRYRDAFNSIPELADLTTTPFMVEIVTRILPKLEVMRSNDASMKEELFLLIGDEAASQVAWGCLSKWLRDGDASVELRELQEGLEAGAEDARVKQSRQTLRRLSKVVWDALSQSRIALPKELQDVFPLEQVLKRVVRRNPVRRAQIYEMFTADWFEREARKATLTGDFSSEQVMRETAAYVQRLALQMTEEDVRSPTGQKLHCTLCTCAVFCTHVL